VSRPPEAADDRALDALKAYVEGASFAEIAAVQLPSRRSRENSTMREATVASLARLGALSVLGRILYHDTSATLPVSLWPPAAVRGEVKTLGKRNPRVARARLWHWLVSQHEEARARREG